MVREIGSERLKVCLDAPLLNRQDDAYVRQAVVDTGADRMIHSHFGGEYDRKPDGSIVQRIYRSDRSEINYWTFLKAMAEIGYTGYITYELCHPFRIGGRYGTLKDSEEQAALACEYMRNIIAHVST